MEKKIYNMHSEWTYLSELLLQHFAFENSKLANEMTAGTRTGKNCQKKSEWHKRGHAHIWTQKSLFHLILDKSYSNAVTPK